ncbi:MAG TPA: hypothetical protein VIL32_12460 [Steroidobacteraceae bacterium]
MRRAAIHFQGRVCCQRESDGPLGLTLIGRTQDQPQEQVQLAFATRAPADIPDALENVVVEQTGEREYRIASGGRSWEVHGVAHLHRDVAGRFYQAIPGRPVPWTKRLFWRVMLGLAARPAGRWLLDKVR